jgi:hypothetical protein
MAARREESAVTQIHRGKADDRKVPRWWRASEEVF